MIGFKGGDEMLPAMTGVDLAAPGADETSMVVVRDGKCSACLDETPSDREGIARPQEAAVPAGGIEDPANLAAGCRAKAGIFRGLINGKEAV